MPAAAIALAVAFAFASPDGSRLLVTAPLPEPAATVLRDALCSGGQRVPVQFERRQVEDGTSTARQTPSNFTRTAGAVFRAVGSKVESGATCLLDRSPL
jgi:hypothetical protein